tara:strand:+ start:8599 stop:8802 length:204 start_codon:yes stop_codon:yes gene_type:complete
MAKKTQSKVSPTEGSKRGCLCKNGKYSSKCCDGSLQAQGIGQTASATPEVVTRSEDNGVRTTVRQNG